MKGLISKNKQLTLTDELEIPVPQPDEVLVRVMSSSLNLGDPIFASGEYDDYLPESKGYFQVRTGLEYAGIVAKDSGDFKEGDKVYSYVDVFNGQLAHKEFVATNRDFIAPMPKTMSFDEAASLPSAAMTSLGAVRDVAKLQDGERILINGAAGGLGIFAVQFAKKVYKAHVTAVAGSGQEDFLRSLGADVIIDYHKEDIIQSTEKYDVIIDLATVWMYADISHLLSEKGRFVPADPMRNEADLKDDTEAAQKTRYLLVDKGNRKDLDILAKWIDSGIITTHIDSTFSLENYKQALKRLSERSKRGRIILQIAKGTWYGKK